LSQIHRPTLFASLTLAFLTSTTGLLVNYASDGRGGVLAWIALLLLTVAAGLLPYLADKFRPYLADKFRERSIPLVVRQVTLAVLALLLLALAGFSGTVFSGRRSANSAGSIPSNPPPGSGPSQHVEMRPNTRFFIVSVHSSKCVNVKGASAANSVNIVQYRCDDILNNKWTFDGPHGDGYYYIKSALSTHRCMNVKGGTLNNGASIVQYDCDNILNNRWYLDGPYGDGYYRIRSALATHGCISVDSGLVDDGAGIIQYDCGTTTQNVWYLRAG
jgi:hypothetical protein